MGRLPVGTRVIYSGDDRNHDEATIIPPKGVSGEILHSIDGHYQYEIKWDVPVYGQRAWWYHEDVISPIFLEEF